MAGARNLSKCAARGGMTKQEVHAAVRERDGNACTKCGMTDEQHVRTFGRSIQVHRREPGRLYTVAGCVLLCCHCHKDEPKRATGAPDEEQVTGRRFVTIPPDYHAALVSLAKRSGRPIAWELAVALNAYFAASGLPELPKPWLK